MSARTHLATLGLAALLTLTATSGCRQLSTRPATTDGGLTTAPDFTLPAHTGQTVSLSDLLRRGPAVVVFYRGHW